MKPFILLVIVSLSLTNGHVSPKLKKTTYAKIDFDPILLDDVACSDTTRPRVLSDPSGTFVSPNHPDNYPNNANCWWLIVTDQPDYVIELNFDVLETENGFDAVLINDGNTSTSTYIAGFDGLYNPAPTGIRSTGPSMLVRLVTDSSAVYTGFSASYNAVPFDATPDACYSATRPQKLTEYAGTIQSKGYPNYYWNYADCQWIIESQEEGGTVLLTFDFFKTETNYDLVYIFDGENSSGEVLAVLTGNLVTPPGPYQSTGRNLFILFISDQTIIDVGFSASYTSLPAK